MNRISARIKCFEHLCIFFAATVSSVLNYSSETYPGEIEILFNGGPGSSPPYELTTFIYPRPNGELWIPSESIPSYMPRVFNRYDTNFQVIPSLEIGLYARSPFLTLPDDSLLVNLFESSWFGLPRLYHLSPNAHPLKQFATDGPVFCLAFQRDGKILVGGNFAIIEGQARNCIARLLSDLSVDASFDIGIGPSSGILPTRISAIEAQPDGSIYIGGNFSFIGFERRHGLARLLPDGNLDLAFNPGTNLFLEANYETRVRSVTQLGNHVYVASTTRNLVRFDLEGNEDRTWSNPLVGQATVLKKQKDGKLLMGSSSNRDGPHLIRLHTTEAIDNVFRSLPPKLSVDFLELDSLDRAFVSGDDFNQSPPRSYTARLVSDLTAQSPPLSLSFSFLQAAVPWVSVTGPSGKLVILQGSVDLLNWNGEGSALIVNGKCAIEPDFNSPGLKFYRARLE